MKYRESSLGLCLVLCAACHRAPVETDAPPESAPPAPDRLTRDERLPESETAFGLALPKGMKLVRHFNDSAYFAGNVDIDSLHAYLREHMQLSYAQMAGEGALFPRAQIIGDDKHRVFRVETTKIARGSQLRIDDITPPAALTGVSEEDIWRAAGRKPDGTPLDPNQLY